MSSRSSDLGDAGLAYLDAGRSVLPPVAPGAKFPSSLKGGEPHATSWKRYQLQRASAEDVRRWFTTSNQVGLAIAGGRISGVSLEDGSWASLEFLDIEDRPTLEAFESLVAARGYGDLLNRLPNEEPPRGGAHLGWLCIESGTSTKLAMRHVGVRPDGHPDTKTLIETRGEGALCVVAPTPPGIHPDCPERGYVMRRGSWADIPIITPEARQALLECAKALNEYIEPEPPVNSDSPHAPPPEGSPGEDFNQRATQAQVRAMLTRHGWTVDHYYQGTDFLRRPGKSEGYSATLGHVGANILYVFSSNAMPFQGPHGGKLGTPYAPFSVYGLLEHHGDFKTAARILALDGYGVSATSRNGHREETAGDKQETNAHQDIPLIRLTTQMTAMVDALENAILALADGPRLFQRARQLCIIGRGIKPPRWLRRPPDAPVILPVVPAYLRELATEAASWQKYDKRGKSWESTLPPPWIIETLAARPSWKFPMLEGVICTPTLRPDGTILMNPGYDQDTGLFLDINGTGYPPLRDQPTLDDARTAIGRLQEPFNDFPFMAPCHVSAAYAAILSLVARYAIQGNVPLFAVRSTTRGAGKGLAIDVISAIATGRPAPRWAQTEDQEEERKRLLTIALAGDPALHIDNVTAPLGSAPLDLALTAATFSDRILGQQVSREAPMHAVFFASGNNMVFAGDLARRVVPIDLYPQMERPEERDDFQHSPLLPWVLKERPTLVIAALTILKAYFAAGCPSQGVKPLGSFEEWSQIIRQALIWAGEADPCAGRHDIEAESDLQYEALQSLLIAWHERYGTEPHTVKELKQHLDTHTVEEEGTGRWIIHPDWRDLHSALVSLDKYGREIDVQAIGKALRSWKGRMINGKRLITAGDDPRTKTKRWRVEVC